MITTENKEFLKSKFNIDTEKYNEAELNIILDRIMNQLKEAIQKKTENIKALELEIIENS